MKTSIVMFFAVVSSLSAQIFQLGPAEVVPNPGVFVYNYVPDGHITFLHDTSSQFQMYWAGQSSYRTIGTSMTTMGPADQPVLTAGPADSFDNGGAWLYSVFRLSGKKLIGFYHAEDHEFPCDTSSHFTAWVSVALCTSADDGITWQKRGQIIRSYETKPCTPTWGGNGNQCVIWDGTNRRWVCFYEDNWICMAISQDSLASPGTWFKYYSLPSNANDSFYQPGLNGQNSPIPALTNYGGGNPSVHFNTFLKKWVMVWHTWDGQSPSPRSIWMSTSINLIDWTVPVLVLAASANQMFWYPTIVGDTSDVMAGQTAWLCYAFFPDVNVSERQFLRRKIEFSDSASIKYNPKIFKPPRNSSQLKMYDELGRDIVNRNRLSSGIYFYRPQGSSTNIRKCFISEGDSH